MTHAQSAADSQSTLAPCGQVWSSVNLVVLLNAAEEEMAEDFATLAPQWLGDPSRCLGCMVLEAGLVEGKTATVVTARKGRCVWRLEAVGIEGHAGNAHHVSRNAIVALSHAMVAVSRVTDYEKGVTVNVGVVQGGTVINTVPGSAVAEVCPSFHTHPPTFTCPRIECRREGGGGGRGGLES